ncbi:MAG: RagB/SusD family nutrient uptake outer membrane protein [Bacteroidetes bacterium MedPE-SWsnd-G2]|nr:MAG: RagB/SusD family nutrient uptake outer membrane protein [Bacteroidetes bacterium MedPE-SWsnd-G2]
MTNYFIKYKAMYRTIKMLFIAFASVALLHSCADNLDLKPEDDRLTGDAAFEDPAAYKQFLAKLYAGLALSGQDGPAGDPDLVGLDEGTQTYLRLLWMIQELPTDEAVIGWDDGTIKDLHYQTWTSGNEFIRTMYSRLLYQVALTNEFLRQTSDGVLADRGVEADLVAEIQGYRTEARFLRALAYYHALDVFGNVPFVTENDPIGSFLPQQIQRVDLFDYVESELLEIENLIAGPRQNEYGRADRAAVWMLLSKLYLNSEVYTGTPRYSDVITYTNNVINAGYSVSNNDPYFHLFLADNDSNGTASELIFPITFDGLNSQTWGGMTFLIHGAVGGTMNPADYGINGGWGGMRTTSAFVSKFDSTVDLIEANNNLGTQSDWGLVGSATENSWDGPDMEMFESSPNVFQLYAELVEGEMKFRFDEDWGVNYGDDGPDGSLDDGGANILIGADGTYFVTLDLNTLTYSIELFEGDQRALFYTDGQSLEIDNIAAFNQGYAIEKFRNVDVNGNAGSDSTGDFVDTDFPLFRLADAYLMYAEANLRGGGGNAGDAITYINILRQRAYGNDLGAISQNDFNLDFILDERARELFWECHRRTDLIRFGQFTTQGIWPWKGNVPQGTTTAAFRDLMPLPATDLGVNTNLTQNEGY